MSRRDAGGELGACRRDAGGDGAYPPAACANGLRAPLRRWSLAPLRLVVLGEGGEAVPPPPSSLSGRLVCGLLLL